MQLNWEQIANLSKTGCRATRHPEKNLLLGGGQLLALATISFSMVVVVVVGLVLGRRTRTAGWGTRPTGRAAGTARRARTPPVRGAALAAGVEATGQMAQVRRHAVDRLMHVVDGGQQTGKLVNRRAGIAIGAATPMGLKTSRRRLARWLGISRCLAGRRPMHINDLRIRLGLVIGRHNWLLLLLRKVMEMLGRRPRILGRTAWDLGLIILAHLAGLVISVGSVHFGELWKFGCLRAFCWRWSLGEWGIEPWVCMS
jgi:hypothetical protein